MSVLSPALLDYSPGYLPAVLSATIALFAFFVYRHRLQGFTKLPPGPPRSFFGFGNTPIIPDGRLCCQFEEWGREYGELFTIWIGWKPLVVVGGYEAAMALLEKESSAKTADRPWSIVAGDTLSGGKRILLVKYSERWRRLRKLLHQGLQTKMAVSFQQIQDKAARIMIQDIIDRPEGELLFPTLDFRARTNSRSQFRISKSCQGVCCFSDNVG